MEQTLLMDVEEQSHLVEPATRLKYVLVTQFVSIADVFHLQVAPHNKEFVEILIRVCIRLLRL